MSGWPARLALGLILLLCVSFSLTRLAEVDLHWHLLAGRTILDEGRVPRQDRFTFTSEGRPWVDLHWLFQTAIAAVHRRAGWRGLDFLKAGLAASGFTLAAAAALRRAAPPPLVACLGLVSLLAAQERFTLRPEVASFCFLGALLFLLEAGRGRSRVLLAVPILMALWANVHALYAVGLAVLVLTAAGELLDRRWGSRGREAPAAGTSGARTPPAPWRLVIVTAVAALATLATPYGLAGWDLPRRLLLERIASDSLYARSIAEFQAPFGGFGPTASVRAFACLVLIVAAALAFGWRRARAADLLLLLGFLPLALLARRNIPLVALVALPAAAPAAGEALRRARAWLQDRLPGGATLLGHAGGWAAGLAATGALLLLVDVWSNRFFERDGIQRSFGVGEAPGIYPRGAARFVRTSSLAGEAFNDMTAGGYLAWSWFPQRRVFIDGRLEVHDESLFAAYLRSERDPVWFEELARRYGIEIVVWSHRRSLEGAALLKHLAGSTEWRLVFLDLASAVFARAGVAAASGASPIDVEDPAVVRRVLDEIQAADLEAAESDPAPRFLRRLLPLRQTPVVEVGAGLFFGVIGHPAPAEALFRAAIDRSPGNATLHYDLGIVLDQRGRPGESRSSFETALRLDPSLAAARGALGLRMLKEGDERGALEQWRAAERLGGDPGPAALQARGALRARRGEIDEAIEDYRRAVRSDPFSASLSTALALLYHRRGLGDQAEAEIRRALGVDSRAAAPRIALARIRSARGDEAGAESALRQGLALSPGNPDLHLALAALLASSGRADEALAECGAAIGAGLDPAALWREPALRILGVRPEFRELIGDAAEPEGGTQ